MTVLDWVWNVMRRPGVAYERARHEWGSEIWLVILSALTLQAVAALYGPSTPGGERPTLDHILFGTALHFFLLVQVQAMLLAGTVRLFGWKPGYKVTLRLVALAWGILLVESIVAFYPLLIGMKWPLFWGMIPLDIWYAGVLAAGVRGWGNLTWWQAGSATVLAVAPLYVPLYWLQYLTLS